MSNKLATALIIIIMFIYVFYLEINKHNNLYKELQIISLDIGQGDSTLILTPYQKKILIDTGSGEKLFYDLEKFLPFWDKEIDIIFISHFDQDHSQALIKILEYYHIKEVYLSYLPKNKYYYPLLQEALERKNTKLIVVDEDSDFWLDNIYIDIIYPFILSRQEQFINMINNSKKKAKRKQTTLSTNNKSMVFLLKYRGFEALFTGDITSLIEKKIIHELPSNIEYLKVAHHGSKSSSNKQFIEYLKPEHAIINVGINNPYKHPHHSVLQTLNSIKTKIYRTDIDKNIIFKVNTKGGVKGVFSKTKLN